MTKTTMDDVAKNAVEIANLEIGKRNLNEVGRGIYDQLIEIGKTPADALKDAQQGEEYARGMEEGKAEVAYERSFRPAPPDKSQDYLSRLIESQSLDVDEVKDGPELERTPQMLTGIPGQDDLEISGGNVMKFAYTSPWKLRWQATRTVAKQRAAIGKEMKELEAAPALDPNTDHTEIAARIGKQTEIKHALEDDPVAKQFGILMKQSERAIRFWAFWFERSRQMVEWRNAQLDDENAKMPRWFGASIHAQEEKREEAIKRTEPNLEPAPTGEFQRVIPPKIEQAYIDQQYENKRRQIEAKERDARMRAEKEAEAADLVDTAKPSLEQAFTEKLMSRIKPRSKKQHETMGEKLERAKAKGKKQD
jgi:hypothetical protein